MLILILIDVQYLHDTVFSFKKVSCSKNHSSSGSDHPVKKLPPANFLIYPLGKGIYPSPTTPLPYCYMQNPDHLQYRIKELAS